MVRKQVGLRVSASGLLVMTAASMAPAPAGAAVRQCGEFVVADGEDPSSEVRAKQQAMAGWTVAAAKLGPAFALWRNAVERRLTCTTTAAKTWHCEAHGRPCGVSQVPGQLPPNSRLPQPPSQPKAKGIQANLSPTTATLE